MTDAQKVLLEQLAASLFGVPTETEVTQEVIVEAMQQAVATLLPIDGYKEYWRLIGRNVSVTVEHQRLHELLTKNGIPYAIMKGVASAAYYPDPDRRQMGDVDFIVGMDDLERTAKLIEAEGYAGVEDRNEHHVEYIKGNSSWEMHWKPPGFPDGHAVNRYAEDMIQRAVLKDGCMCVSDFHHGLVLLTHSAQHLLSSGIGLRHVCDWAVFYASFTDQGFCDVFEEALKETGLWRYAQVLTQLCIQYLGAPDRQWARIDNKPLIDALLTDILTGGNFGLKEEGRHLQGGMIADFEEMTVEGGGRIKRLTALLCKLAYAQWPLCEKYRILLPAGIAYVLLRRGWLILTGKRKPIGLGHAFAAAQERRSIYQEFRLFQPTKGR